MKYLIKRTAQISQLVRTIGIWEVIRYASARYIQRKKTVFLSTPIGRVLLRTQSSDIKVLYGAIVKEYPLLSTRIDNEIVFFDLGAYTGISSLAATRFMNVRKCFCFEPSKANFEILQENLAANQQAILINAGIGDCAGKRSFSQAYGEHWSFSEFDLTKNSTDEICDVITLNYLSLSREVKNFIKIDIEGSEVHLLSLNNCNILKKFDYIFIETHERIVPGVTDKFIHFLSRTHIFENLGEEKLLFQKRDSCVS